MAGKTAEQKAQEAAEAAVQTEGADPAPLSEDTQSQAQVDPDEVVEALISGHDDGPLVVTRPGIESESFTVKDGKISTTRAKRAWLLQHVGGVTVPD
jgi:hypothetical protein